MTEMENDVEGDDLSTEIPRMISTNLQTHSADMKKKTENDLNRFRTQGFGFGLTNRLFHSYN